MCIRDSHDIAHLGIARMFQNIELFDNLTVLENLMLGRHLHLEYGVFSSLLYRGRTQRIELENRRIVEDIIDFLEIEAHRKSMVGMLPYGVKKRVELGRALAMEPKLLLLDEPVAGMNIEETEDMARFILDIRAELGVAMIMVEHDMGLVMDLADRILAVDFGQPLALGTPREVQSHPDVIKAYLGEDHAHAVDGDGAAEGQPDVLDGQQRAAVGDVDGGARQGVGEGTDDGHGQAPFVTTTTACGACSA